MGSMCSGLRISLLFLFLISLAVLPSGAAFLAQAATTSEVEAQRAKLQAELEAEEREIAAQAKILEAKQRDNATVKGELDLLRAQIARAQANIKAKKVEIAGLDADIARREQKIETLETKIIREQSSLAELLRKTRDFENQSLTELVLASQNFSDLFADVDDYEFIQKSLHNSFAIMREAKTTANEEKRALEGKKNKEIDAQQTIEAEKALIAKREAEKNTVLTIGKNQEATYQQVLAARQKRAAQIRAALFALRDTAAIPFGEALEFANVAQKRTGVRPAFLLAILKQESNLGENVGSCFLSSMETGDGVGKNTGTFFEKVMKPPRDTVPFLAITTALGRDWRSTPVSCPIGGTKYYVGRGFGGAMGPAQFIPSTWQLFASRIASLLGKPLADPWQPEDAFTASALYLADLGARNGTYSGEIAAACKYYGSGGGTCAYGSQVMAKAIDIQLNMIDPLQNL